MKVKKGHVSAAVAILMLLAHIGLLPFIFFFANRFTFEEQIDVALLIGPITTVYLVTIVNYVRVKGHIDLSLTPPVNYLYLTFAVLIPIALLVSLFGVIALLQSRVIIDAQIAKRAVGVIELFLGDIFALMIEDLFSSK